MERSTVFSWFTRIGIARIEKLDQELPRPRPMERKTVSGKESASRGLMKNKTVNENQRANNCFMPELGLVFEGSQVH